MFLVYVASFIVKKIKINYLIVFGLLLFLLNIGIFHILRILYRGPIATKVKFRGRISFSY